MPLADIAMDRIGFLLRRLERDASAELGDTGVEILPIIARTIARSLQAAKLDSVNPDQYLRMAAAGLHPSPGFPVGPIHDAMPQVYARVAESFHAQMIEADADVRRTIARILRRLYNEVV